MKEVVYLDRLSYWQKKIFIISWFAYALAYLGRANLAIALPKMINTLNLSKTNAGLIGSFFFWAYAIGQLVNGYIGDKVNSRYFVFCSLLISALINLLVGFTSNLVFIIILWTLNGFTLSMLWGPLIKTLSHWFSKEKRDSVAVKIATSITGGYLLTWGFIGWIIGITSWRWAFWSPAIILGTYSFIWFYKIKPYPEQIGLKGPEDVFNKDNLSKQNNLISTKNLILSEKLIFVALTCMSQGLIREGIILWGPTFLYTTFKLNQKSIVLFSLFIPFISLMGIIGSGYINKLFKSEKLSIIFFLGSGAAFLIILLLTLGINIYINVILLSFTVAAMYGANTLLLTLIPLKYTKQNMVSSIAGFLDFNSYLGAAFSGVLIGYIIDISRWSIVIIIWLIVAIFGIISTSISLNSKNNSQ